MKQILKHILIGYALVSAVCIPITAHAQSSNADCQQLEQRFEELGGTSSQQAQEFLKKFPKHCTAGEVTTKVITIALSLAAIVAVIAIIYGGFLMMTSAGNEEAFGKGRQTLVYAVVGLIVIIMAGAIVALIINFVNK
jgi:hypothetical protein